MNEPSGGNDESTRQSHRSSDWFWAVWAVTAAFGTYFCMYGLRKPFTAASFEGPLYWEDTRWEMTFKVLLVTAQTLGYMVSKFIGIKVISELPPHKRAGAILGLCALAEGALFLFAITPRPWNALFLFANGLPLGMVFGLVLGFLEGRRLTELLTAGLCFSFILADGVVKSVGKWLLDSGFSDEWMPAGAGLIFLIPLAVGALMLSRIPPPSKADEYARAPRATMTRKDRWDLYWRYALGFSGLVMMYFLVTVLRSVRSDFAPEIWKALGTTVDPTLYTRSETIVGLGSCTITGALVAIQNSRRAFFAALSVCAIGLLIVLGTLIGWRLHLLGAFPFMVLFGLGLYLPYVATHTTLFERFLAMTRDKGTIGFLMYVADAIGYLGYIAVMVTRRTWDTGSQADGSTDFMSFFSVIGWTCSILALFSVVVSWIYFARRCPSDQGLVRGGGV